MVVDFRHVESVDQNLRKLVVALIFLHKHYGSLEWKDLVKPAADLAKYKPKFFLEHYLESIL